MNKLSMILVAMACFTASPGLTRSVSENVADTYLSSQLGQTPSPNGATTQHIRSSAPSNGGRPLGTIGVICVILTALGAIAVTVAGYFLVSARPGRRDLPYVLLCAVGFALLVTAAFGLILLNR
ncbi:hypothetical protein QP178_05595 [Sphingomonas aurantiaca]|uniref:hypothetical protein n=1 Tax=Sphingomonas aurantiaca TaxID=185949 RepID=UPI002FE0F16F